MSEKVIIKKWIIFTEFRMNAIPYILDSSKLNVTEDELALCIQEQFYGKQKNE